MDRNHSKIIILFLLVFVLAPSVFSDTTGNIRNIIEPLLEPFQGFDPIDLYENQGYAEAVDFVLLMLIFYFFAKLMADRVFGGHKNAVPLVWGLAIILAGGGLWFLRRGVSGKSVTLWELLGPFTYAVLLAIVVITTYYVITGKSKMPSYGHVVMTVLGIIIGLDWLMKGTDYDIRNFLPVSVRILYDSVSGVLYLILGFYIFTSVVPRLTNRVRRSKKVARDLKNEVWPKKGDGREKEGQEISHILTSEIGNEIKDAKAEINIASDLKNIARFEESTLKDVKDALSKLQNMLRQYAAQYRGVPNNSGFVSIMRQMAEKIYQIRGRISEVVQKENQFIREFQSMEKIYLDHRAIADKGSQMILSLRQKKVDLTEEQSKIIGHLASNLAQLRNELGRLYAMIQEIKGLMGQLRKSDGVFIKGLDELKNNLNYAEARDADISFGVCLTSVDSLGGLWKRIDDINQRVKVECKLIYSDDRNLKRINDAELQKAFN